MRILVVSHGKLSKYFVKTAEMIYGESSNISYVGLEADENVSGFEKKILNEIDQTSDSILILADLLGGSPMIASAKAITKNDDRNVQLIAGINLALILEILHYAELNESPELDERKLKEIISNSKDSIKYFVNN